jgi:putative tryptophan/tyrosine transport system substrate-binding protein
MAIHIGRRELIATLGGAVAAWPLVAQAQQPAMPVIGFLNGGVEGYAPYLNGFRQGLKTAGYIEGQNIAIEYRWAEGRYDRLPALAADLVDRKVTLIVANTPAARAAQAATKTIPIVFVTGADPVALGFVASLNRPGGNLTGVASLVDEIGPKRLELVHELLPTTSVFAVLVNPTSPAAEIVSRDVQSAARELRQTVHILNASTEGEIEVAFARVVELRAGALLVMSDPFFNTHPDELVALAARHAIPVIYPWRDFVVAGGLMSYGTSLAHLYRQLATYVARIIKGEKPVDLPVQQSTEVELIINMRTAKQLGLAVPIQLLGRADEIIE